MDAHGLVTIMHVDVEGSTALSTRVGDAVAQKVLTETKRIVRERAEAHGGREIDAVGDAMMMTFASTRAAIAGATAVQEELAARERERPDETLRVRIGLNVGEVLERDGTPFGAAVNAGARVMAKADGGEILVSEMVRQLAGTVPAVQYRDRGRHTFKGFDEPWRLYELVWPGAPPKRAKPRVPASRRRLAAAAALGALVAAAIVAFALFHWGGTSGLTALEPNALGAIDADGGGIASQVKLDSAPSAIASGGGFVWAASETDGTVSRFDTDSQAIVTSTVRGRPGGVAFGAGSLWVTNGAARGLVQINPETFREVQTIPVGNAPGAVTVGEGAVWVVNKVDGTVSRFDLRHGSITNTIPVGPSPSGIAVGAGAVWVASEGSGTVLRIDPASRDVVQPINVGNGPTGIAVGAGGIWVVNSQDRTVSRVDPSNNNVTATISVGGNPSAVAADSRAVWVASSGERTITRIDPDTGQPRGALAVGSSPSALAVADGQLWAATLPPLNGHRGGVLRVESTPSDCRCVDPVSALGPDFINSTVSSLVYDGLVAYRRVAGVGGGRLVPNLAVRLPAPTDDGRTYTFHLRRGIRYSNGTPIRASDFRFSVERDLAINQYTALGGIAGGEKCQAQLGKRCDLTKGIEADDEARTITIRLAELDTEFLYKLALLEASLVPAGTPLHVRPARRIPGTGPYRIASFDPAREVRLVRNEHFRVWSADGRPDGYPDEIRFYPRKDREERLAAVEKGTADWVSLVDASVPPERQRGLVTRSADRLHNNSSPQTFWWFLNTRVAPFDDVRVRRALNYALDRKALVELTGGLATPTCQLIPPSFPGYQPYCPYTRNPNAAGTWTAPDLARARALIAASGTAGMRIEVPSIGNGVGLNVARHFVSVLRQLGYRTSLRVFTDPGEEFAYAADSRNRAQLGPAGWRADTLAASNFLRPLFACAAFVPKSAANLNLFEYCDRTLDAKMTKAAALQASDPVRADELWAEVDHHLVDQAVAVSWGSPSDRVLVSKRVGNYQSHPLWGTLFDQLWVK